MKIALLAPIEESVPPKKYGGTELVVYNLTEELVKRGYQVTLFASGDSKTSANLFPVFPKSLRKSNLCSDLKTREAFKFIGIVKIINELLKQKFDLIHNHIGWRLLLFGVFLKKPILTTLHGPLDISYQRLIYQKFRNFPFVSVSQNQRKLLPELNFIATVYHGIDTNKFLFAKTPNDYFAFLGRISPEKGPLEAIKIAKRAKIKLKMAAKIDVVDIEYFKKKIEPLIDNHQIEYLGEIGEKEKSDFLGKARGLMAPIQWEEPFGLAFIESMACGTPVITFARGSVPEVVEDGKTGFIINPSNSDIRGKWIIQKSGIEGMCEAVKRIYAMANREYSAMREKCRKHIEKNFSIQRMVDEYEKIYYQIVKPN